MINDRLRFLLVENILSENQRHTHGSCNLIHLSLLSNETNLLENIFYIKYFLVL